MLTCILHGPFYFAFVTLHVLPEYDEFRMQQHTAYGVNLTEYYADVVQICIEIVLLAQETSIIILVTPISMKNCITCKLTASFSIRALYYRNCVFKKETKSSTFDEQQCYLPAQQVVDAMENIWNRRISLVL